jgi:hypothetical protein
LLEVVIAREGIVNLMQDGTRVTASDTVNPLLLSVQLMTGSMQIASCHTANLDFSTAL